MPDDPRNSIQTCPRCGRRHQAVTMLSLLAVPCPACAERAAKRLDAWRAEQRRNMMTYDPALREQYGEPKDSDG